MVAAPRFSVSSSELSPSSSVVHPVPVGGAATSVWAGVVEDLDENVETRGERWRGEPGFQGQAQKMLTDPHVRAARDVLIDPVVAAEWDFEPGGGAPKDIEAADLCRHLLLERFPWKRTLGEVMRSYVPNGFGLVEKTDNVLEVSATRFPLLASSGRAVGITGLYVRPAWSIYRWHQQQGDGTKLDRVTQYLGGSDVERAGFIDISRDRFIRFTWEQDGADFEGAAPQRSAWGPWFVKRLLTKIEAMGHEKNHVAMPLARPVDQTAGNDDDDKKMSKVLANWRAHPSGNMVLPFGYELVWSQHGQQTNIAETIRRCNFDIAHNYGSGFMLLGQAEGPGSYALAGTQKGQYDLGLGKHGDFICDVFNFGSDGWSLIERIVRLSYGAGVAIPRLVVRYMPTVDWEKVLPILGNLAQQGIVKRDDRIELFARRGLKAPAPQPETQREDPRTATENIGAGANIQAQLPNGAQVISGVGIIEKVAARAISRESGRAALMQFYGVSAAIADSLLGPEDFEPAGPPAPVTLPQEAPAP